MTIDLFTPNLSLFTAVCPLFSGGKTQKDIPAVTLYKTQNVRLWHADLSAIALPDAVTYIAESVPVHQMVFFDFASALSTERRIGDIVASNVFFRFDEKVLEVNKDNRDQLFGTPIFLTQYTTQSDTDLDGFGFSIGGICLSIPLNTLKNPQSDVKTSLQLAYEADICDTFAYDFCIACVKNGILLDSLRLLHGVSHMYGTENIFEQETIANFLQTVPLVIQSLLEDEPTEVEIEI